MKPKDTDSEAYAVQIALLRNMSGADRVSLLVAMSEQAREVSRAGIRQRHPQYTDAEIQQALARLLLGDALYGEAYPDQPLVAP